MSITLRIDNMDQLPDGGPVQFVANGRGFDVGRESHLDWSLPDPGRMISGRHCEIRFENGGYSLYDVSRNGTYLNGSHQRVKSPYRLVDGDRLQIGQYIIAVSLREAQGASDDGAVPAYAPPPSTDAIWDAGGPVSPPISRRDLMPPAARGNRAVDFAEQYIEMPGFRPPPGSGGEAPPPRAVDPFADASPFGSPPAPQPYAAPAQPFAPPQAPPFSAPAPQSPYSESAAPRAPAPPSPSPYESPFGPAANSAPAAHAPAAPLPQMRPMPGGPEPMRPQAPAVPAPLPYVESEPFAPPRAYNPPPPAERAPEPGRDQPSRDQPYREAYREQLYRAPPPPDYAPPPQQSSPQQAAPQPASRPAPQPASGGNDFAQRFAIGAGVAPDTFAGRDPGDVAEEVGRVLRLVTEELTALLKARAAAKVLAKSGSRTMVSAADNNPLKFIPRAEEALEIMFGKRRPGYLDARRSFEESFRDLKTHEFATYAAMQRALSRLLEDLSPDAIDKKVASSAFASKKGRAWDTFVATWEAKAEPHENGMLDVFLTYFADAYEKATKVK